MSIIIMLPCILVSGEIQGILSYEPKTSYWAVVWPVAATGLLGFGINIAVFLQIKYTSPLTSVIVGSAKVIFME